MTARRFRVQPTDIVGVLLAALVLGAFLAPVATAVVCFVVIAVWAALGVATIVGGLIAVHVAERDLKRQEQGR